MKALETRSFGSPSPLRSTTELIAEHLPPTVFSTETASNLLLHGIQGAAQYLIHLDTVLSEGEGLIKEHFTMLAQQITQWAEQWTLLLATTACMETLTARCKEIIDRGGRESWLGFGPEQEVQEHNVSVCVATVEGNMLGFMARMAEIGIKMARQRLITELFKASEADQQGEDAISAMGEAYSDEDAEEIENIGP